MLLKFQDGVSYTGMILWMSECECDFADFQETSKVII